MPKAKNPDPEQKRRNQEERQPRPSAACGRGSHGSCAKLNCTCPCHPGEGYEGEEGKP